MCVCVVCLSSPSAFCAAQNAESDSTDLRHVASPSPTVQHARWGWPGEMRLQRSHWDRSIFDEDESLVACFSLTVTVYSDMLQRIHVQLNFHSCDNKTDVTVQNRILQTTLSLLTQFKRNTMATGQKHSASHIFNYMIKQVILFLKQGMLTML